MDFKKYTDCTIYYFSGTGNAKNVAVWISEVCLSQNIPTIIYSIAEKQRRQIEKPNPQTLIIIISPVHGFNYPPITLHFIAHFPKGGNPIILMNTRAGMKIGKWITPGLSGISFYFSAGILKLKGYSIIGLIPVDMPSNWLSLHPALNKSTTNYLHTQNKIRVTQKIQKILLGKKDFTSCREIIQDILISPISVLYYCIGRFFIAKTFYASSKCNNCGICITNCPIQAIERVQNRPFWTFNCESCMQCMNNCPTKAIETHHALVAIILILNSSIITVFVFKFFAENLFSLETTPLKFIVSPILMLTLTAILYRMFHYLLRFRWFERIIVFTSLTSYKFWGRYKAKRI